MRLDYVLPSIGLRVTGSGVFWPLQGSAGSAIADGSDHHLLWMDLAPE
jgi:hypothetical protein